MASLMGAVLGQLQCSAVSQPSKFRALCNHFVSLAEFLKTHSTPCGALWASTQKLKDTKRKKKRASSRLSPTGETKPNSSPLLFSKSLSILTIGGPGGAKMCSHRRLALYGVGKQAVINIKLEITEETLMMWKNINKRLSSEGSYNIACMFGCIL